MDGLEVASDLKSAAKRLMDEATSETADGRLELLPGLPPHEVYFEIYEPIPNGAPVFASERGGVLCRFRIREERWHRDVQGGSMKVTLKRLANLQPLRGKGWLRRPRSSRRRRNSLSSATNAAWSGVETPRSIARVLSSWSEAALEPRSWANLRERPWNKRLKMRWKSASADTIRSGIRAWQP